MKSAIIAATASLLSVASAVPLTARAGGPQAALFNLQIASGDGDASSVISVPLGFIAKTSDIGGRTAVAAELVLKTDFTCQAFADPEGTKTIGDSFNDKISYNDCSAASTSCVLDKDAVKIGAWCCAANADFQAKCLANIKDGKDDKGGKGCPAKNPGNDGGDKGNNGADKTVRVQVDTDDVDGALQREIPADGKPHALKTPAVTVSILDTKQGASCQLFADAEGKVDVGPPFSTVARPDAGRIGAISCSFA